MNHYETAFVEITILCFMHIGIILIKLNLQLIHQFISILSNTMSTMNDAQRLVSLSLGKLACSRSQRGGPQLRKALLLSTVLYKAREAFIHENNVAVVRQQCVTDTPVPVPERQRTVQEPDNGPAPEPIGITISEECTRSSTPPAKRQRINSMDDKENMTPLIPSAYEGPLPGNTTETSDCDITNTVDNNNKCVKRVLEEVEECSDNKRIRLTDINVEDNITKSTKHEPIDCLQISSLVNRFNSGLSGCLSSKQTSDSESDKNTRLLAKNSSNCRTIQVKEGFESINRAVISITV